MADTSLPSLSAVSSLDKLMANLDHESTEMTEDHAEFIAGSLLIIDLIRVGVVTGEPSTAGGELGYFTIAKDAPEGWGDIFPLNEGDDFDLDDDARLFGKLAFVGVVAGIPSEPFPDLRTYGYTALRDALYGGESATGATFYAELSRKDAEACIDEQENIGAIEHSVWAHLGLSSLQLALIDDVRTILATYIEQ